MQSSILIYLEIQLLIKGNIGFIKILPLLKSKEKYSRGISFIRFKKSFIFSIFIGPFLNNINILLKLIASNSYLSPFTFFSSFLIILLYN